MENVLDTDLETTSNTMDTKSITPIIVNTHCIVCGKPFQVARMGKLYCSTRCKQFGYNHKAEIHQALAIREKGINPKPMIFIIDDHILYDKKQKMLKRFRELERKRVRWESIEQEIEQRQKSGLLISNYLLDSHVSNQLTEEEKDEIWSIETELEEKIMDLKPYELSLEQWSFIKSLYPALNEIAFFQVASSLSKEFLGQLNLRENATAGSNEYLVIKNKFVNHCNLVAMGIIQFIEKEDSNI